MGTSVKKRTTVKEKELAERIRGLEEKLAASVPKAEFETVKANLQLEINDLKTKLSLAENQASRVETSIPADEGLLDEDGFEERDAENLTAKVTKMGSSTEGLSVGESEETETNDSEDEEPEEP